MEVGGKEVERKRGRVFVNTELVAQVTVFPGNL